MYDIKPGDPLYRVIRRDSVTGAILTTPEGELVETHLVGEREAVGRYLGAFEESSHRDNIVATLKSGKPLFTTAWRVEFVG